MRVDRDPVHQVQFYEDETFLVECVGRFVGAALGAGDAAVVVATAPHRASIEDRLKEQGVDVPAARAQGRYLSVDAAETLAKFMVGGMPDERRFVAVVGGIIARAARRPRTSVRVFGEMVGLLCAEGNHDAAVRLEQLWNDLALQLPFSLLCAYPIGAFGSEAHAAPFLKICGAHSDVTPAESYSAVGSDDERRRIVTQLQQKAGALDHEVRGRTRAEDTARERNRTLQALVAASPVPIVVIDPDTTVRLWNPAAERVFGWSEQEAIGRPIPIVPPEKLSECARVRDAVVRGESFHGVDTSRTTRDGRTIDVLISAAPLTDAAGVVRSIVLLFEDVTERNRTEAARQKAMRELEALHEMGKVLYERERTARAEAESASRAKDEFLAMLGHELRNPLAAVQNAIVTARVDGARRDRAIEIAGRQADQLGRLVDDLLDVARITQGKITLRTQRVRFASIVERAVETSRPRLEQRGHAVAVSLSRDDVHVDGDPTRLEQVVVNLLDNAAKYTEPGGRIEISTMREGADAVLRVRDNGAGIAPHVLPRVFDLFAQADRGLDRAGGGLGIGLTVVRRLVEMHGGQVRVHSAGLGHGAEFVVRVPALAEIPTEVAPAPSQHAPGTAYVLLLEDNPDVAESMTMLMELLGHRVRTASSGEEALALARASRPDVMLVDIGLPGMNGYEVARRVRRDPALNGVVLIALTGYGREEDRREALAAGFDHHLAKPVEPGALHALVARIGQTGDPTPSSTVH